MPIPWIPIATAAGSLLGGLLGGKGGASRPLVELRSPSLQGRVIHYARKNL